MTYLKFVLAQFAKHSKTALLGTLALMALMPSFAFAVTATATVTKNTVEIDEPFQLTIAVDSSLGNSALNLTPLAKDFNYSNPHINNSTSVMNGTVKRLTEWRIMLAAKEIGNFSIPSFTLDGAKTLPISIKVIPTDPKHKKTSDLIQIISLLDQKEGYIGESFTYKVRLMIGASVDAPSLNPPYGEGLKIEQVGEDTQNETLINGRRYIVVNREYQIIPTKTGTLTLDPAVFSGTEITNNRWGTNIGKPFSYKSNQYKLLIKEKPEGYTGLWIPTPALELTQEYEPAQLTETKSAKVGEPIHRIITLKIKNMAQSAMPNIELEYPDHVRVYSDKPEYLDKNDFKIMRVKQVIIPRKEGEVTLPAMKINWFNTQTKKQETSALPELTLNIEPGEPISNIQPVLPLNLSEKEETPPLKENLSAGYWPWTTGFFAFLWLITLGLYGKKSGWFNILTKEKITFSLFSSAPKTPFEWVRHAVKENDPLNVSIHYAQWDRAHIPEELTNSIETEIQAMMASHYNKTTLDWNNTELLTLLQKASKIKSTNKKERLIKELK